MKIKKSDCLKLAWFFLILETFSISQHTHQEALSTTIDLANIMRILCDGIAVMFLIVVFLKAKVVKIPKLMLPWIIYLLFGGLSILWSASVLNTTLKIIELLIALFIVILTLRTPKINIQDLLNISMNIMRILLTYGFIGYILGIDGFYQNSMFSTNLFRGQIMSPLLTYGGHTLYATILILYFLHIYMYNRDIKYLYKVVYYFIIAFLAFGRTPLLGLLCGIIIFIYFYFKRIDFIQRIYIYMTIIISMLTIIYFNFSKIITFLMKGQSTDQFVGLTGRVDMWEIAGRLIKDNLFLGVGFGVGSRVAFTSYGTAHSETVSSVHNGFIEVLCGVGVIGFIIWLIAILLPIIYSVIYNKRKYSRLFLMYTPLFIISTFMSNILGGWYSVTFGIYFILIGFLIQDQITINAYNIRRKK